MFEFFKRLFPDKYEGGVKVDPSTLPVPKDELPSLGKDYAKTKYRAASCQSTGRERSHNEDTLYAFSSLLAGVNSPDTFGIYLVADGMGGHQSGEVASSLAAQAVTQYLMEQVFAGFMYDRESFSDNDLKGLIKDAVDEAQTLIKRRVPGGGTTLTFVLVLGDRLFYAHVGDSRLYLIGKDGSLTLKTKDHTLVKRLVDLGEISEQEAGTHPQRNVLYRALGQTDPFEPAIDQFSMDKGERLLICSDGLWSVLTEDQILGIIANASDLEEMAYDLVDAANVSGGPDNISVILVERLD